MNSPGKGPDEMLEWGWQSVHDPRMLPRVVEKFRGSIAAGEAWEDTFPLRRHDGAMRWHLSRALPIRDASGQVVRWFGTNTDITDRMEMEEALKLANRHKDEFLATLAHELRNPLAPIRNSLGILRRSGPTATDAAPAIEMAEHQVRHMARMLDDLLDVARISRGRLELQVEPVDLVALVNRAVARRRFPAPRARTRPHSGASAGSPDGRRRPHPARAGRRQPNQQCSQVHGSRRTNRGGIGPRWP